LAIRASQSQPVEAEDLLEMREQHLDLLATLVWSATELDAGDVSRYVDLNCSTRELIHWRLRHKNSVKTWRRLGSARAHAAAVAICQA
jgi:hypothetical protein